MKQTYDFDMDKSNAERDDNSILDSEKDYFNKVPESLQFLFTHMQLGENIDTKS